MYVTEPRPFSFCCAVAVASCSHRCVPAVRSKLSNVARQAGTAPAQSQSLKSRGPAPNDGGVQHKQPMRAYIAAGSGSAAGVVWPETTCAAAVPQVAHISPPVDLGQTGSAPITASSPTCTSCGTSGEKAAVEPCTQTHTSACGCPCHKSSRAFPRPLSQATGTRVGGRKSICAGAASISGSGAAGGEPESLGTKILNFQQAFWKFLRPHTIRGTVREDSRNAALARRCGMQGAARGQI